MRDCNQTRCLFGLCHSGRGLVFFLTFSAFCGVVTKRSLTTPRATVPFPKVKAFFLPFLGYDDGYLAGSRLIQYRAIGNMPAARTRLLAPGLFLLGQFSQNFPLTFLLFRAFLNPSALEGRTSRLRWGIFLFEPFRVYSLHILAPDSSCREAWGRPSNR